MEIIIQPSAEAAAGIAAKVIAKLIRENPNAVLGLATGSTPLPLYRALIAMDLDWSKVVTFNLDEYIGIPRDHAQSYHTFMWENLFQHVNIREENVHIPDGNADDIPQFCREYEESIRLAGGIDIQVLGIGTDGHIGFNEPGSSLKSRTRVKTLSSATLAANIKDFDGAEPPTMALTMGIATILEARRILLIATGASKADAVREMAEGPLSANCPASALQLHEKTAVLADPSAASLLKNKDYYQRSQALQARLKGA